MIKYTEDFYSISLLLKNNFRFCIFAVLKFLKRYKMGMNKNTVLAWATFIMILMGLLLIGLGIYRYADVAGWGFSAVGVGFFAIAWVFNALKGRV